MQQWLLGLLAVGAVFALAFWLWCLTQKPGKFSRSRHSHPHHGAEAGCSVWCFQGGNWGLLEDKSGAGFVPGPAPSEPGLFDGYCMKVASIRDAEAH
jgi:hypothetical protein